MMLPIVCVRLAVLTMICAWLQVFPPSVVLEKNAGPVYACACGLSSGLSVGRISVSHTVYANPAFTGSAVVAFLSVPWSLVSKKPPGIRWMWSHVAPPSTERAATTALAPLGTWMLNDSAEK